MTADPNEVVARIREGDKIALLIFLRGGGDPNARNNLGWTLLHIACLEGQAEIAQVLLDAGATVNACTTDMCTPLHRACTQGYKQVAEILIEKKAYLNAQDKNGNTPLHEAAKGLHTSVVKLLLERKADRKRKNRKGQIFTDLVGQQLLPLVESGDTEVLTQWLDWGVSPNAVGNLNWSLLHHSSARGQLEVVLLLMERNASVNCTDSNKSTPLHSAAFHGHEEITKILLKHNPNLNAQDQRGNTPLHSAIAGGHPEIIRLLLESGCETEIPNSEGQIFTHLVNEFLVRAVHEGKVAHVLSLLKGRADPNTKDANGTPVLCYASFKGEVFMTEALLEAGADPNLCAEDTHKTPLHYAASAGNLFVLKLLLDKNANITLRDNKGSTPLHEAAREGILDIMTVLTGRRAPINGQDNEGNTPLHTAAKWGQTEAIEQLIETGAQPDITNNAGLIYSDLALIRSIRTGQLDEVTTGLAWGGNPNSRDHKGLSLLHHAVNKDSPEICKMLLECKANINAVDPHGRTPLLLAAYKGNQQIMQLLVDAGAGINAQDWNGNTPLHWASREGSIDAVCMLLENNADKTIRNNDGLLYTNFLLKHLYLSVRHNDITKVLKFIDAGADQFAELEGTGVNPRQEAKRRGFYPILQQMAALAKKDRPPKEEKTFAIEDVHRLFECENSRKTPLAR